MTFICFRSFRISRIGANQTIQIRLRRATYYASPEAWLDVVRFQIFDEDTFTEGYAVPAGSHKVASCGDTKWIMPDQVPKMLRKKP